ncbi:MAG: lipid A deacylase LpxR family protein, partial [Burkholderiales bacterium]
SWSYLGFVAQREKDDRLISAEIDIGVVGPASGGGDLQTAWHKLIDSPKPLGWGNQIPSEIAFVATAMYKRRLPQAKLPLLPLNVQVIPHMGLSAGTVITLARAGGIVRVGRNMSGFGPDTIEPGGAMLNANRNAEVGLNRQDWEAFAFVGADHRLIAHNIFLDGTVFHKSASVERRVHVYDLTWGFAAQWGRLRASLTRVRRSEEFHTQLGGGGGRQHFDSINIGYVFH